MGGSHLRRLNLDGDRQADLTVHGGKDKAVYCYPLSHYEYWKRELPGRELPMGMFGENFTIELDTDGLGGTQVAAGAIRSELSPNGGLPEDSIRIGDRFSVGSAEVIVTQPRLPCYKLGIKFQMDDMVKRFLASRRTGFYVAVIREGEVGAGDEIRLLGRDTDSVAVSEITRLYIAKSFSDADAFSVQRALRVGALPESWKEYFRERLGMIRAKV